MYEYIQPLGSRAFIGRLRPYNYPRDLNYNWLVAPKYRGALAGRELATLRLLARDHMHYTTE